MKRIIATVMAMAFVFAFGTAYAGGLTNGITDFSGGPYDTFAIASDAGQVAAAGGPQGSVMVIVSVLNGVTDFAGGAYDLFVISPLPVDGNGVAGTSAGGSRTDTGPAVCNGITDFSGATLDTGAIGF